MPLACTLAGTDAGHFIVLSLTPPKAAHLMGRGQRALWETRVHESDPERIGLGSAPLYVAFSGTEAEALARHEVLLARLEAGTFEAETGREILAPIRPFIDRGAEAYKAGDHRGAVAAFEEAIRIARRMDAVRHFLHLYLEVFLMRALAQECIDPGAAKSAYREFIQLYADSPTHHRDTLRGVAKAREAVERLTPTPREDSARRGAQAEGRGGQEVAIDGPRMLRRILVGIRSRWRTD